MRFEAAARGFKVEPRPYQRRIVQSTVDMFLGNHLNRAGVKQPYARSVLIESPTGSGKSVIALMAAKMLQHNNPNLVIGWVAMRRELLRQAEKENVAKEINVQNIHYTSMFARSPSALVEAKAAGKKILLVVDESQHDATSSMAHLHNIIQPEYVLGMTATPFRTDRVKLCFDQVIRDAGIHQLILDGFLSPYHHYTIQDWKPETIATRYLEDPKRWGPSIFFFHQMKDCFELSSILNGNGIVSEVVTGDSDRETQLKMFADGDVKCVINCMVLSEGFDAPFLSTAWVRDSGRGPTIQMGGRVFRKHKDLPFKQIVQSKGTHWPFLKTATPKMQYIWQNNEWMSLEINEKIEDIAGNAMWAIANIDVTLPKFLTNKKTKKRVVGN